MLKYKNAIITGANRGIGKAILQAFAENGCNVWACTRQYNAEFAELCARLAKTHNVWIKHVYFDLRDENALTTEVKSIIKEKLPLNILVNNAGIGHNATFQMTSMRTVRELFEINVISMMQITQLVLRDMQRRKNGTIINMASIAGIDGRAMDTTYGASKAAVIAYTRSLAAEVGQTGIRVNALAPGYTNTEMLEMHNLTTQELLANRSALNRFATCDEIANAAVFLASDRASYVNGSVLRVDGGMK